MGEAPMAADWALSAPSAALRCCLNARRDENDERFAPAIALQGSLGAITSEDKAIRIAQLCDEQKGEDIVVLDIRRQCSFTDCIVLITGMSSTHLRAMLSLVAQDLKKQGSPLLGMEGGDGSAWLLMDYGDVVVHLFMQDTREYYNIERLWGDGQLVEWEADAVRS